MERCITTISTEQTGMIVSYIIAVYIFLAFAFVMRSVFNGRIRPVQSLDHYTGSECDRMSLCRCKIFIQFIVNLAISVVIMRLLWAFLTGRFLLKYVRFTKSVKFDLLHFRLYLHKLQLYFCTTTSNQNQRFCILE